MNPFTMLMNNYNSDDLVVVKLDVDNNEIETALVNELSGNRLLMDLIDQFYFEHHVNVKEMQPAWGLGWPGNTHDSLSSFYKLRQSGVAAHFWP